MSNIQLAYNIIVGLCLLGLSINAVAHNDAIISNIDMDTRIINTIKDYHYEAE